MAGPLMLAALVLAACGGGGPRADGPTTTGRSSTTTAPTTTMVPLADRILVVGDSLADDLARGLAGPAAGEGVEVANHAVRGCGVARSGTYRLGRAEHELSPVCEAWSTDWQAAVQTEHPKVVVIQVGRHELLDRVIDGRWSNILEADYARYVRSELLAGVDIAGADGAAVVLLTAPLYRVSSTARPEDDPARRDRFNALLTEVAAADPRVTVIDLGGHVSPGGDYSATIDGVLLRPDGVHYSDAGVAWLAPWLVPQLVALLRQASA